MSPSQTATTTTTTTTETQTQPTTTTTLKASSPSPTPSTTQKPAQQEEEEDQQEIYDEIEIEDMTYDPVLQIYHYPCPCGDRFEIPVAEMRDDGRDIAVCPGCSLTIRVIFDVGDLEGVGEG